MIALPEHEQGVLDRLNGANPLGWRPEARVDGVAIIRADVAVPELPHHTRICRVALTEEGMVGLESIVLDPRGRRVKPPTPRVRRIVARERVVVADPDADEALSMRCPTHGQRMVRDGGWYRCPEPKCKVVI